MSLTLTNARYNWMGYHGTESEEGALLRWTGKQEGVMDYNCRQGILNELEQRLFIIKIENGLLSPEEIEEMERRRAEAERERQERLERQRLLREERFAAERAALEDEEMLSRADLQQDFLTEVCGQSNACSEFIRLGLRSSENHVPDFNRAVRSYLIAKDSGFVSYLDGSFHTSLDDLDKYNETILPHVEQILSGSRVRVPDANRFRTKELHDLLDRKNLARMRLDAFRCRNDPDHVQVLRTCERQDGKTPRMQVENDLSESHLSSQLENVIAELKKSRSSYNAAATAAAAPLVVATASYGDLSARGPAHHHSEPEPEHHSEPEPQPEPEVVQPEPEAQPEEAQPEPEVHPEEPKE